MLNLQKAFVVVLVGSLIASVSLIAASADQPQPSSLELLSAGNNFAPQASAAADEGSPPASGIDPPYWLNHFDLLPGADELTTSHDSTSSGVGGGLTGLVIESSTTGDEFADGGNKVVHMAASVPPGYEVVGVRTCYELTSNASFITQVRLAQVDSNGEFALVLLDDGTNLTDTGPVCVDSGATSVDPSAGALLVSLRLDFGNTSDKIVVRGLALNLVPSDAADILWLNHFDLEENVEGLTTSHPSTSSGVGGGLTGVLVESLDTGSADSGPGIGIKAVTMGVEAPPNTFVRGVRVCYELTSSESFITQIRLAQLADPPASASVFLDDATHLTDVGPTCADSGATSIDADDGALGLSFRFNFSNTSDRIVIRGAALHLATAEDAAFDALESALTGSVPGDYSNPNHRKTFLNKLNAVSQQIANGSLCEAIDKLTHDMLPKTDGESPPPDWVTNAALQAELEQAILDLKGALADEAAGTECGSDGAALQWLNQLDLLPGADELTTTLYGGGWLIVESSTTGDTFADGGNKVVNMGVSAPVGYNVTGVRVCYSATSNASFLTQVRLAQVDDPPSVAWVVLDDGTNQTDEGPICVDTSPTDVDPTSGALLLSLRFDFGSTADSVMIRGVALFVEAQ